MVRPRSTGLVIGGAAGLAVLLLVLAWLVDGPPRNLTAFVLMSAVALVAHLGQQRIVNEVAIFNVGGLLVLATIPLGGGVTAAAVGLVSVLTSGRGAAPRALVFNAATRVVMAAGGGLLFNAVAGGAVGRTDAAGIGGVAVGLLLTDMLIAVLNAALMAAVVATTEAKRLRAIFLELVTVMGLSYLSFVAVALAIYVLWVPLGLGAIGAVLSLPFVWGLRWTTAQFADEVLIRDRVTKAVLAALEERHPGSAARGERVARWSAAIAQESGLSVASVHRIQTAGALAEVDALTLPARPGYRAAEALRGLSFTGALIDPQVEPLTTEVVQLATEVVDGLGPDDLAEGGRSATDPGGTPEHRRLVRARDRLLPRSEAIDPAGPIS